MTHVRTAKIDAYGLLERLAGVLGLFVLCSGVFHAPVSGNEYGCTHSEAHAQYLEHADEGICQGCGCQGIVSEASDHHRIEHVDTDGYKALKCDGKSKCEYFFVEI